MNKLTTLLISSLLFLSACTGGEQSQVNNETPIPNPTPNQESIDSTQEFTEEETPAVSNSPTTVSGLIPSTNPQNRLAVINRGKSDPFSSIAPPSIVKVTSDSDQTANRFGRRTTSNSPNVGSANTGSGNDQVARVQTNTPTVTNIPDSTILKPEMLTPEVEETLEAEEIFVSGIVDLQGQNVALVTTPWDGITRSVRVGDVISDSTGDVNVQVKEISFNYSNNIGLMGDRNTSVSSLRGSDGMVVLEQNGELVTREVAQEVGDEAKLEGS